jgi:hypothetical protein
MAPRASWPATWNEFLPISMPINGDRGIWCLRYGVACSLFLVPLAQLRLLAGQEHSRTIPTSLNGRANLAPGLLEECYFEGRDDAGEISGPWAPCPRH